MAEYISREAVMEHAEYTQNYNLVVPVRFIKAIPAADVQPVKHGRWELTDNPSFRKCSECGAWWSSDITDNCFTNYCPKCGARMDGDTNGT